jgi:hypothetical protein
LLILNIEMHVLSIVFHAHNPNYSGSRGRS